MSRYAKIGLYKWQQTKQPPIPYKIILSTLLAGFEVRRNMKPVESTHILDANWSRIL